MSPSVGDSGLPPRGERLPNPAYSRTLADCRYLDVPFYFGFFVPRLFLKNPRFALLCLVATLLIFHWPAQAQGRASGCVVAEFRSLTLQTHDVSERIAKVTAWLKQKGPSCTLAQLAAISSNRATWLGTADTVEVAGNVDALMEAKIAKDPDMMAAMYASKGKENRSSVEVTKPPPAPAPVVAPPASLPAPAFAGNNLVQPLIGQAPLGAQAFKPEVPDAFFGRRQREQIQAHYEETRGPGECPRGMVKNADKCESRIKERNWKLRQPLPNSERPEELPTAILLNLGPPAPDHQYKRVGFDILMLKGPQNIVTDAVLDLGGIQPKVDKKEAPSKS